jgi:bud site selection protein 31
MASRRFGKAAKIPDGYDIIEPTLEALENELRDKVKESNAGKRNTESIWPVHQINWQKSRYVYDMYYTYHRIPRKVYDYCIKHKIVDAGLIAKWKKSGYERLCSTYVINPANYKFGTTSICRVPIQDRSETQLKAQDPTTGCLGCASGNDAASKNIFGNKYGQNLAAVQIAREKRMEAMQARREEQERLRAEEERKAAAQDAQGGGEGDSETDDSDSDDDDYGPSPAAGVWAKSQSLITESEAMANGDVGEDEDGEYGRPSKKARES